MSEIQQYQVLARKYRPTNFDDLVGQQALVRTLTNALKVGRIASAFVLTGVRGVGKTTTARIVAKALNCDKMDENGNLPIKPCGTCTHCQTIAHGTHMDVLEMDAASHTGIDDIRDIIDSTQYKPVTARYKVFILDEVHMLSKSAFNALLKILEEPPAHVKFILATTDIDKVPVTVLSRCQRFDLRRITVQDLMALYTDISVKEGFKISADAVRTIAVAADGSARDGLSILDQALALSTDKSVNMDLVVSMLGLADKQVIYDIFESLMRGDVPSVLDKIHTIYRAGADPLAVLNALIDVNWLLTRYLHTPTILDELSVSEMERNTCVQMSKSLTVPVLTRTWQVLQKGITECSQTERPIMALEMVLIRVAYMAHVPSVASLVKSVQSDTPTQSTPPTQQNPTQSTPPIQQNPTQSAPPTQQNPAQSTPPTQQKPAQSAPPTQQNPAQSTPPTQQNPAQSAPPTQQNPTQSAPPTQQNPTQSAPPIQQNPAQSAPPTQQNPIQSTPPTQQNPTQSTPPTRQNPTQSVPPIQQKSTQSAPPIQQEPTQSAPPIQQNPVQSAPPTQQKPAQSASPTQQNPVQSAPPTQQKPIQSAPPIQQEPTQSASLVQTTQQNPVPPAGQFGSQLPVQKPSVQPPSPPASLEDNSPPENFNDWVQMFKTKAPILGNEIWRNAGLVSYAPPVVACTLQGVNQETQQKIRMAIGRVFGQNWQLHIVQDGGQPTLKQQHHHQKQAILDEVEQLPEIQAIKNAFPNATVKQVDETTHPEYM